MIPIIDFSRKSRSRNVITNVYLLIPKECKMFSKLKYNKQKYKVNIVSSLKELREKGYVKSIDRIYIIKKDGINKLVKKSKSILESARIFYDEESCFSTMCNDLK